MADNNKGEKQLSFREEWTNFYESFSMHGIHFICETKGIRRLLWFLLVCCCFGLSVYLFQGVISDYMKYKTATVNEEIFDIDAVEFPTITICNLNAVSRKRLKQGNISEDDLLVFYNQLLNYSVDLNNERTQKILVSLEKQNVTTMMGFLKHFDITMEDMMDDDVLRKAVDAPCSYDGAMCSTRDFVPIIASDRGLCEQFNSYHRKDGTKLYTSKIGIGAGLDLFLNLKTEDTLIERVPFRGLAVYIHPYGTPFDSPRSYMIPVQPGTVALMHVKMMNYKLLPPPYSSSCIEKKPYLVMDSPIYSKPMCEVDCLLKEYIDRCGCVPVELLHHQGMDQVCEIKDSSCLRKMQANYDTNKRACAYKCPLECNFVKYEISSDNAVIRSKAMIKNIMTLQNWNLSYSDTEEYVRNNLIGLDVSFSDISLTKTTLLPSVTWSGLLGSIGGNIGLCLGASLVSFVEIFVFAFDMAWKACNQRKKD